MEPTSTPKRASADNSAFLYASEEIRNDTVKPMPQAQAAGNMSRTRSPLAIFNPATCVESQAVIMMPKGLPITNATMTATTTGETNSAKVNDSKCTPVANSAKIGKASNAENGCSLSA